MLTGKNVVIVKSTDKNTPATIKEYDRVYLEFASTDALEEYTKTSEGKDLLFEGKIWKGLKPKPEVTAVPASELVGDALAFFQSNFPGPKIEAGTPEEVQAIAANRAWLTMLEAASYGADLWKRNSIQAAIRPSKPMDASAVLQKQIKLIMNMNPKLTLEKATTIAKAMLATLEDSESAAA